ncbi:hypothetical protein TRFO_04575 [Tritrichomonas foetus]|uniref:Uncharacterized protein n=1 Tax=Tritrichomonas foetus TaxID=1144522 RepID=A0A1J4KIG2_9EUKA|nr:hypothetical protein TRFO_04575 [Tritrichomonas foetus]|eukprot:OHT09486.1 hypothetical protein TRFO_04575 [Tritrichomonas foetus]
MNIVLLLNILVISMIFFLWLILAQNSSKNESLFLSEIFIQLGNDDYFNIYPEYQENLTIDNVLSRLENKLLFYRSSFPTLSLNSFNFSHLEDEISFISENFYLMIRQDEERKMNYEQCLKDLECEILERIFQHHNLKLFDEDSLFNFIFAVNEKSKDKYKSFILYENVKFEYLSSSSIEKFISIFDVSYLTTQIWSSLCQRLMLSIPANEIANNNRYTLKVIEIPYKNTLNEGLTICGENILVIHVIVKLLKLLLLLFVIV